MDCPLAPTPPPPSPSDNNNSQENWAPVNMAHTSTVSSPDIFARIEKLAALQSRGILSPQEYADKKTGLPFLSVLRPHPLCSKGRQLTY